MASFFGVNIETPQEAQAKLRDEMLNGLAWNQKQSTLQGVGYALSQAGQQAAQKWGGVVPEQVRVAQETEDAFAQIQSNQDKALSEGIDPLKARSDALLEAAKAMRPVNPAAYRQLMQQYLESEQTRREKDAAAAALKAQEGRNREKHEADMNSDVAGLTVRMDDAELRMNDPSLTQAEREKAAKAYEVYKARKDALLKKSPEYDQVELSDGIYWVNKSDPKDRHYIGPVYREPKGVEKAKEEQTGREVAQIKFNQIDNLLTQFDSGLETLGQESIGDGVGPVQGRIPSETGRNLRSISSELAVQIKPLIRTPGEGTWTDADQKLLDSLVPQITDDPATIARKKANLRQFLEENEQARGVPKTTAASKGPTSRGGASKGANTQETAAERAKRLGI